MDFLCCQQHQKTGGVPELGHGMSRRHLYISPGSPASASSSPACLSWIHINLAQAFIVPHVFAWGCTSLPSDNTLLFCESPVVPVLSGQQNRTLGNVGSRPFEVLWGCSFTGTRRADPDSHQVYHTCRPGTPAPYHSTTCSGHT